MIDQATIQWMAQVLRADPKEMLPISGGGNNRVYRIITADDRPILLKQYYYSAADPRDRLRAEFDFVQYAWETGIRSIPRPIAESPELHCALYEFLEGRKPQPSEITETAVRNAIRFINDLNENRAHERARSLAPASEACFCVAEHLQRVDGRISRIHSHLRPLDETSAAARLYVEERLLPAWTRIRTDLQHRFDSDVRCAILPPEERCISPSDFGFHNALIMPDGSFRFLDFEYAGWDDPAKLVGDFFSQVALPVSPEHIPLVIQSVSAQTPRPETTARRIRALLPLYRIKWCCIVLNEFIPDERRRRSYACGEIAESRQHAQMEKACRLLDSLKELEEASS